jgi:serine/threonine protein kinase
MSLTSGTRLGPYEIASRLGAGGMGEVYKARDTRLDRTVAIKILAEALAADPVFRERFIREGRAISQLSHPHICALHDIGDDHGIAFLVMEYLEGGTLADRLAKGPLPFDQALRIGIEITSALDRAHRAGIAHRDLKPGNIILTSSGAKLLDFGLAKTSSPVGSDAAQSATPTMAPDLTARGTIVGTFQYMSPEQLEGQEADARADIFSFGVVLYEMLTGRKAFEGKTQANLIGEILKSEPPSIVSLIPSASPALDRLVQKCLAKDREARWQSARDLHDELEWIARGNATAATTVAASSRWRERAGWIAAAVVAAIGAVIWITTANQNRPTTSSNGPTMRLQIMTPATADMTSFAIAPDGRTLAYQTGSGGNSQLWLRPFDSGVPHALEGTAGAAQPFWSPDSRSLAFFAAGQLKRLDLESGVVRTIAPGATPRGGSWGAQNVIIFTSGSAGSLSAVSANGGEVTEVTHVDRPKQSSHRFPHYLPDGRSFLYYSVGDRQARGVYISDGKGPAGRRLTDADSAAVFFAPDRVLYAQHGALWSRQLDMATLQMVGDPELISKQVALDARLFGNIALAETALGMIAYRTAAETRQYVWYDRSGRAVGTVGDADDKQPTGLELSPDGRTVVFRRMVDGNTDLWSIDLTRNLLRRLTTDSAREYEASWSATGDRMAFNSDRNGVLNLYEMNVAAGTSSETLVLDTPDHKNLNSWSPDGRHLLFSVQSAKTGRDLWVMPLFGDRQPVPIATSVADEARGQFSPDGRWVAYDSGESGRFEIYVQSFPDLKQKRQVSTAGGSSPSWRKDGREMYFASRDQDMMAVPITATVTTFESGVPTKLFALPPAPDRENASTSWYGVSRDGQRFLVNTVLDRSSPITVLLNWKPTR